MDTRSDQNDESRNDSFVKRRSAVFSILGVITVFLIVAAILIPGQVDSRVARNEASAIGSLRALTTLQRRYAADNPSKGFACELAQLRAVALRNGESDHEALLVSQTYAGYRFSLSGCEADPNGAVVRYKATAIPSLPGETGVRAFCTDQTGELRYGVNGSPESCRPL